MKTKYEFEIITFQNVQLYKFYRSQKIIVVKSINIFFYNYPELFLAINNIRFNIIFYIFEMEIIFVFCKDI